MRSSIAFGGLFARTTIGLGAIGLAALIAPLGLAALTAFAAEPPAPALLPANGPTEKDHPALHRLLQVSDRVYVGGEPHGAAAFAALQQLGVKVVVSVDGAAPDVAAAAKQGLRYVHIPIGYDGVPAEARLALARLMQEVPGPVYIHCHHGQHRGPAAAAVACVVAGQATGVEAEAVLRRAGTSADYAGLWRDVRAATVPPADSRLPELMAVAQVDSLVAAMAQIDRAADNLKLLAAAGWKPPADHPDLVVSQEALLLEEGFRESVRHLGPAGASSSNDDRVLRAWLADSLAAAQAFRAAATPADRARPWATLQQQCKQCHARFRN